MFVPRNVIFLLAGCLALTGFSVLAQAQVGSVAFPADVTPDVLQMAGRALGWIGGILMTVLAILGTLVVYIANELWATVKSLATQLGLLDKTFTAHSSTAMAKLEQLDRGHIELKQDAASARESANRRAKQLHEVQEDVTRAIDIAAQSQARVEAIAFRVGVTGETVAIPPRTDPHPTSDTSIVRPLRKRPS